MEHLSQQELSLDEVTRRTGLPSHEITASMTTLAIKGLITQKPGGIFAAKR